MIIEKGGGQPDAGHKEKVEVGKKKKEVRWSTSAIDHERCSAKRGVA